MAWQTTRSTVSACGWVNAGPGRFRAASRRYQESTRSARREGILRSPGPTLRSVLTAGPSRAPARFWNGTVDLRNGQLVPADREHLMTRGVDLEYDASARSDDWEGFLARVLAGDADLISSVRRLIGYASARQTSEHVLANFCGQGGTASRHFQRLRKVLGGRHNRAGRFACSVEIRPAPGAYRRAAWSAPCGVVRAGRAANDRRGSVRLPNWWRPSDRSRDPRPSFQLRPSHTLMLVTNNLPRIPRRSRAI